MTCRAAIAAIALVLAGPATPGADSGEAAAPGAIVQRHHYAISARVRPLLLFWIARSGIGDAVVTRRQEPGEADYSLLIGSDPDRAPRRINRWGYLDEHIRGGDATLIGLMTESDEASIEQAEANIKKPSASRTFKVIRSTIDGGEARSVVQSIGAPAAYSFRDVHSVLDLARSESGGRERVVRLPPGTRPGFLPALAELVHAHVDQWRTSGRVEAGRPIAYVYYGRIYELTATHTNPAPAFRAGGVSYAHVLTSEFEVRSTYDGERTQFSITYGTEAPWTEVAIAASYQPRWWLQLDLTLDDTTPTTIARGPKP